MVVALGLSSVIVVVPQVRREYVVVTLLQLSPTGAEVPGHVCEGGRGGDGPLRLQTHAWSVDDLLHPLPDPKGHLRDPTFDADCINVPGCLPPQWKQKGGALCAVTGTWDECPVCPPLRMNSFSHQCCRRVVSSAPPHPAGRVDCFWSVIEVLFDSLTTVLAHNIIRRGVRDDFAEVLSGLP